MSIIRAEARMIRSLLSFCLRFFKSRTQLQLEIVYLRKQWEILTGWFLVEFCPGWTFEEGQVHRSPMSGQWPWLILHQQIISFTCRLSLDHSPVQLFIPHIKEFP